MGLKELITFIFTLFEFAILGRIILSFIIPMLRGRPNPILMNLYDVLAQVTEPLLGPVRKILPTIGTLDFSPLVVIIVLQIVHKVLIGFLG
jgi:YggT family protein